MTNEVATVAFRSLDDSYMTICRRRGRVPLDLYADLPAGRDGVLGSGHRTWTEWTTFLRSLERAIDGLCSLEDLQAEWSRHTPSLGPFRRVLGLFVSPEQVLRGVWFWSGPRMFRPPRPTLVTDGPSVVRIALTLPDGYEPSLLFFRFSALATAQLPILIGLKPAEVIRQEVTPTSLAMVLRLPESRSILARTLTGKGGRAAERELSEALVAAHHERHDAQLALKTLADESRDGILVEKNGHPISINPAARAMLHLRHGEGLSDDLALTLRTSVEANEGVRLVRLHAGTSAERFVQVWVSAGHGIDGESRVTFLRDVTDSESLRIQLGRAQRHVTVGETGAILGHEIMTSMAAMLSDLQWCLESAAAVGMAPQVRSTLERTHASARHVVDVARNLLAPSTSDVVDATVDLRSLVLQAADLTTYVAKGTDVGLEIDIHDAPVHALCRSNEVVQILVNLLTNALEAARTADRREVRVSLSASAVVEVRDFGPGLPADLEPIWGEIQSTRRPGGHGLGLLICKRLAVRNGAILTYRRSSGAESVFRLELRPKTS